MTNIKALSPHGFTIEITCPESESDPFAWLLDIDNLLSANHFAPLPIPKSGGGTWNKDGKSNTPRNWVDVVDNVLHVYVAYVESKEKTTEIKKALAATIKEKTGLGYDTDTTTFKDDKGKAQWTMTYPIKVGRELLELLPPEQFERRPTLQARLDAKKDK